jgi:hypothetical protein
MAPHAEDPIIDTSGYMPTPSTILALRKALRLHHPLVDTPGGRWISEEQQNIDSHDRNESEDHKEHILQLTLTDLQEIEDAIAHFESSIPPVSFAICL